LTYTSSLQNIIVLLWLKCKALASTLDEEEISDLRDQFDTIDVDKNGVISLEEMRQVHIFLNSFYIVMLKFAEVIPFPS
jgi:Ca2+-binding EF-hand superfamily protein